MKKFWSVCTLLLSVSFMAIADEPLKLDWLDLIPESERGQFDTQGMPQVSHDGEQMLQPLTGGFREELSGSKVKIPGFVIPLEGTDTHITEFLLVPYFGACIHVPPPPPNQIVYVRFPSGAPVQQLWDVVYVVGELTAETQSTDLALTGYTIDGVRLEQYDDE
ncbi:hypothetical protein ST37_18335 [Vibrio sp. qd031]|uniref:DUF3299 domain-containing protein n=1 Tax=Vibrio sp. qd031 TaxID=1603038 RepID=UPI000A0FD6FC|nr:DUF3299 domain-containing protein [Vibrio sp. qd031]ORT48185.1 hypothetical protein ST37_18335 [Vibrio sp. qd031]